MQIEKLNDKEIIMEYSGNKYKITSNLHGTFYNQLILNYELINAIFDKIEFDDKNYLQLKKDILYNKENNTLNLISFSHNKFNIFENYTGDKCKIDLKNDKFSYYIEYYMLKLSLDNNFTKNGLIITDENIFRIIKELDNDALLKLKDIFIEKDTNFIIDVYKKKDFDRKYKIFYSNEFIKIK